MFFDYDNSANEIFLTTTVCKSWQDINDIPKEIFLDLRHQQLPPPKTNFSKVRALWIRTSRPNCTRYDENDLNHALNIIRGCASSLRLLSIYHYNDSPLEMMNTQLGGIPMLMNLRKLSVYSSIKIENLSFFLEKCPNLEALTLRGDIGNVDFSLIPSLQTIEIRAFVDLYQNASEVNLTEIATYKEKVRKLSALTQHHPNANIRFVTYS
jgi:hypothetical protein